jgi:N-acetylglucosaminyl-diphospho-decaprenol L-rhamnosyltransferase
MTEQPLISLIIVTYNSAALLPECLAAIASTTYSNYEMLVVDNASSDGTPQLVAERNPRVRLLPNSENIGFGRACNQGARAANGELLVFLNPDVAVTPDWLSILARHMADQPDAGILCPQTLYADQSPPTAPTPVADTAAVPGCAMLVRRAAWQQLGGFDERYFLYWEDTDLCWRAWLLGWRVLEDFEAYVYHERGGSAASQRWDTELTKNSLRTYLKTMRWRRAVPFAVLLAFNTMAKMLLLGQRDLLDAWIWNWRRLGETLALRRELARARRGNPADLERLIAIHQRRGRQARRGRQQRHNVS